MPVRLLALDLDGTILDGQLRVSPRVRSALRRVKAAGVRISLASGRPFHTMRFLAGDLGIGEPLICHQGAVLQDAASGELYFHRGVPLPLAHELIVLARQQSWDFCLYLDDRLYAEHISPKVRYYGEFAPDQEEMHEVRDLAAFLSADPTKLVVVTEPERAAAVAGVLQQRFAGRLRVARSFTCFVEATSLEATKGAALAFLARRLGIAQSETMAIGDHDNDADMVAWAGLGVAMGNASPATKAAARHIAPSIEEHGAAEAMERFILGAGDG